MPKKRFTSEDIIHKLREAEVMSEQGKTVAEISRQLGVTEQTYFRWRKEYGGLKIDQAERLKELDKRMHACAERCRMLSSITRYCARSAGETSEPSTSPPGRGPCQNELGAR